LRIALFQKAAHAGPVGHGYFGMTQGVTKTNVVIIKVDYRPFQQCGDGKLIDALDEGRLKLIRICPSELNQAQPWIKELTVKVGLGADKAELAAT
jgi:hypothetical protein